MVGKHKFTLIIAYEIQCFVSPQVDSIRAQLDAVLLDIGADVVKTGMLPSAEVAGRIVHISLVDGSIRSCCMLRQL